MRERHAFRATRLESEQRECRCTPAIIQRYLSKISGPLLDCIDIHIEVPAAPYQELRTLEMAVRRMGLSARAHDRILKVARTIADLDHSESVSSKHLAEAVQYRSLDRNYWT